MSAIPFGDEPEKTRKRTAAAERKRRERERKRAGEMVLRNLVVKEDAHVSLLIRLGYLHPNVSDIPDKVAEATAAMAAAIVTRDTAPF